MEALANLDEDHRAVILHRKIDELSTADTARLMEKSEKAVKQLLFRAMRNLTSVLEADRPVAEVLHVRGCGRI